MRGNVLLRGQFHASRSAQFKLKQCVANDRRYTADYIGVMVHAEQFVQQILKEKLVDRAAMRQHSP